MLRLIFAHLLRAGATRGRQKAAVRAANACPAKPSVVPFLEGERIGAELGACDAELVRSVVPM
jgi:hypothetical protein